MMKEEWVQYEPEALKLLGHDTIVEGGVEYNRHKNSRGINLIWIKQDNQILIN